MSVDVRALTVRCDTTPQLAWRRASDHLHQRVLATSHDSLTTYLADLHRPREAPAGPVCHGCDRGDVSVWCGDAIWPCRTYTQIAMVMLGITDVDQVLADLVLNFKPLQR